MNFKSDVTMTGHLSIKKYNDKQELVEEVNVPNLVVTVGKNHIAKRITSDAEVKMSHMAIGSGTAVVLGTQTTLTTETGRVALSSSTTANSSISYSALFGATVGTGNVQEAALFNAASAGTMLCRTTFPVIIKGASDTIAISWTVTVG
jgi:hypothetical protein